MIRPAIFCAAAVLALAGCNTSDSKPAGDTLSNGGVTGVSAARSSGSALSLASAQRRGQGLSALQGDARLSQAAQGHANWMARNGRMSHTGANGSRMADRMRAAGYKACFGAENVAFGQPNANAVVSSWMGSAGHRRNILDRRARQGAVAQAVDGAGQTYWVMLVAAPC